MCACCQVGDFGGVETRKPKSAFVVVRPATIHDKDPITQVQLRSQTAAFSHIFSKNSLQSNSFFHHTKNRWQNVLKNPPSGLWTLVACKRERVVAFTQVAGFEVGYFYVCPSSWGSGVAHTLHEGLVSEFERRNTTNAVLWVLEENVRAQKFYSSVGWRETSARRLTTFPLLGRAPELQMVFSFKRGPFVSAAAQNPPLSAKNPR